ncbi:MAG: hypothetical protein ABIO05_06665 [Ferruginibacter sp.]
MQLITTEDLIQYLYKETTPEKTLMIQTALETDWALQEAFAGLQATTSKLQPLQSPRQEAVDFILNYAEKSVEEHA